MNINYLLKKKHLFKKRIKTTIGYEFKAYKNYGIYTLNAFRFEFVYARVFKKLFRKKYIKKKSKYLNTKFWILIKPNFLLTAKSKNSRMGSGVGAYIRVCSRIKNNKPVLLFQYYSKAFLVNCVKYFKKKLNLNFLLK